jgi:hypothetical protein
VVVTILNMSISTTEKISLAVAGLSLAALAGKVVWDARRTRKDIENAKRKQKKKEEGAEQLKKRQELWNAHTPVLVEG